LALKGFSFKVNSGHLAQVQLTDPRHSLNVRLTFTAITDNQVNKFLIGKIEFHENLSGKRNVELTVKTAGKQSRAEFIPPREKNCPLNRQTRRLTPPFAVE
jgi:hypothetical protein